MRRTEKEIRRLVYILYERNKESILRVEEAYMGFGIDNIKYYKLFENYRRFFGFIIYHRRIVDMEPVENDSVYNIKDIRRLFRHLRRKDPLFVKIRHMILAYYDCMVDQTKKSECKVFGFTYFDPNIGFYRRYIK